MSENENPTRTDFVVAPIEPDEKMMQAGLDVLARAQGSGWTHGRVVRTLWRAMIAASLTRTGP